MNDKLASSAETAAVFLAEHELPDVACVEITPDRVADSTRTAFQLSASTAELADLIAFAETLSGEVTATVLRRDRPFHFTHVEIEGNAVDIPVRVWTHPEGPELAALWEAIGHTPEVGIRARVELDTIRSAATAVAESTQEASA